MRVELCNKPAGNDQGRSLILDQIRHQLNDRVFDLWLKLKRSVPRNSRVRVPLRGDGLCIKPHRFLRPNLRLLSQLERKLWRPGLHSCSSGGQTPAAWRFFDHSMRLAGIRVASTFGSFPSSGFNGSSTQVEAAAVAGPPEQIEAHPTGGPGTQAPFELWKYHRMATGKRVAELWVGLDGKEYKLASQPAPSQ